MRDYSLDENQFPLKVVVSAVTSYQLGLIVEGLSGVDEGQRVGRLDRTMDRRFGGEPSGKVTAPPPGFAHWSQGWSWA